MGQRCLKLHQPVYIALPLEPYTSLGVRPAHLSKAVDNRLRSAWHRCEQNVCHEVTIERQGNGTIH